MWLEQVDAQLLEEGTQVTLMAWGNVIVDKVHRAAADGPVTAVDARLHLEGDFKKTKLKLTWLADTPDLPLLDLQHFGHLITKRKLEEEDVLEEFVNRDSKTCTPALGDVSLRDTPRGEVIQLERKGYYIVDVAFDPAAPEKPIVLFNIPDGRMKTMSGEAVV